MYAEFSIDDDGALWLMNATDIVSAVNKTNINSFNRAAFSKNQTIEDDEKEKKSTETLLPIDNYLKSKT